METNTTGETSPLLRQLREVADSDEAGGSKADAINLRVLADLLAERRYADAYRRYRSLDTFVREGVPRPIVTAMYVLRDHKTHDLTVDAVWAKVRAGEIKLRLALLDEEAAALRAELAALAAT
jgi:hypothetical protein